MKFMAMIFATLLVAVFPLAHAIPADPGSPGCWDNDDLDEVVVFPTADLQSLDTGQAYAIPPPLSVSERGFQAFDLSRRVTRARVISSRGPPAAD